MTNGIMGHWGSVAIGTRIGNAPEPEFFKCWTALVFTGRDRTDMVLEPVRGMAAHKAANKLVRSFMDERWSADHDSLLLVDDDMSFTHSALYGLRSNKANWDYDIVSALTTTRTWPPKPIIMHLPDEQLEYPYSLQGEIYRNVLDFEDGEVIPVDAVGLAFTLIKRHVFEAMIDPEAGLDFTYFFRYDRGKETEDLYFCRRARELGFKMAVDTSVKVGHIGRHVYGHQDFLNWKQAQNKQVSFKAEDLIPILRSVAESDNRQREKAAEILAAIEGG